MKIKTFFQKDKFLPIFILLTLSIVFFDQLFKFLIYQFQPQWNLSILKIHFIQNTGAGFGILQNQSFWLGLISLVVAIVIIISYTKIPKERVPQLLFALFLGGVLGNMIDRLFRKFVIDFVDFSFWPAFNLADSCVTIAVIGLICYFWKE